MAVNIENYIPTVQYNGLNTQKAQSITSSAGAYNFDYSSSTGTFKTGTGAVTINGPLTLASGLTANVISGSGATATLTASESGSVVLFDSAAGIVFTLPTPAVGLYFDFIVKTTISSNAAKVITAATGTQFLTGHILTSNSGTVAGWLGDGSTDVSVSMNGTTTGGIEGAHIRFVAISTTLWAVEGVTSASGTTATPFATS